MSLAIEVVLRLAGAFYLLAALFGLRSVAMDRLLSGALEALTLDKSSTTPGERQRRHYILAISLLTGWSAAALCAGLAVAAPLLVLTWLGQIASLLAAPRFLDPDDPPPPEARRRSWIACAVFGAVTLLACAAAWAGILRPWSDVPWAAAVAGIAALLLVGYAAWLMSGMPGRRRQRRAWDAADEPPVYDDEPFVDDADLGPPPPSAQVLALEAGTLRVVLTPSWNLGALRDQETGAGLEEGIEAKLVPQDVSDLMQDWLCLFREVGDPTDPRRAGLSAPDGLARLEALGRPIYERLVELLGPDRVSFEPSPRPVAPAEEYPGGLHVMSDYQCHPVWLNEPDRYGCVDPNDLGISWALAHDLHAWALERDASFNLDDPGGPPIWSDAQYAAHEEEGRILAIRLARELAATGRGHVRVSTWKAVHKLPVSAADPLPGEPAVRPT